MRIILTIEYSPWSPYYGGAQLATHNLASALTRRNHDVTVIYTKPLLEKIPVRENVPYEIVWGHYYSFKSQRKIILKPLSCVSVKQKIRALIKDQKDVIIHSNGEEGGLIHQLRKKYKFSFIATPHHPHYPDIFYKNKHLSYFQYVKLFLTNGKYLMQMLALKNADFCTPPSQWAAEMNMDAFNLSEDKIIPVANGVPDLFLDYTRSDNAADGPIVFFGRLCRSKGVDTLIEALHLINDELPKTIIAGRGELEEDLKNKVKEYGMEEKIFFMPWLSHNELAKLLSSARMTVLPSRHENFSLAILESMCVGSPTISTQVGGTPEIIDHMNNGYLVPPGDPEKLAKAIHFYLENPKVAEIFGQNGSKYIREELTWDRTAEHFESIYMDAIFKRQNKLVELQYA